MRAEVWISLPVVTGFLLVLARVAGVFVFVPLPGVRSAPAMARAVLAVSLTVALFPQWPSQPVAGLGALAASVVGEAALGSAVGLAVAFITESFAMAAQLVGLQAGFGYATTVDPSSQSSSAILQVLAQLAAGLLFFASGGEGVVLRILASSLEAHPAGSFALARAPAEALLATGSLIFSAGLRLALPVLALLILVDVALALLGRLNAHLQLLMLAFPAKMLASLLLLAWVAALWPAVWRGVAAATLGAARMVAR